MIAKQGVSQFSFPKHRPINHNRRLWTMWSGCGPLLFDPPSGTTVHVFGRHQHDGPEASSQSDVNWA